MISNNDWTVKSEIKDEKTCVHVHINDNVDLTNLFLHLLDDERKLIVELKVTSSEIYFCTAIGKPMFAELGHNVKYVDGTGAEFYKI